MREAAKSRLPRFHKLEIQFQSELDLPRIIWCVTRRSNFPEAIDIAEVAGSRNRNHAVAAEIGSVEVRMIEYVEELRPELQPETFVELHVFEHGEV